MNLSFVKYSYENNYVLLTFKNNKTKSEVKVKINLCT